MNVDCWAHRSSFVKYIRNFSYNDSNDVPGQACSSTLALHYVYRLKQYYTSVDDCARRSSFVKYIGTFSYNNSDVVPGQHCSSTLAHHSIYRLKQYIRMLMVERADHHSSNIKGIFLHWFECCNRSALQLNIRTTLRLSFKTVVCECWLLSPSIIIRHIYTKLFLHWFECCNMSALQLNTRTTLRVSFKTVLYECWWLSAPIIIRQIYRKLFSQCFECCNRSAFQINTSATFDLSFKNSIIRMLIAERADHHSSNI